MIQTPQLPKATISLRADQDVKPLIHTNLPKIDRSQPVLVVRHGLLPTDLEHSVVPRHRAKVVGPAHQLPGPRKYISSAQDSQIGTDGQSEASGGTEPKKEGESDDSPEVLAASEFDATCQPESADVASTPQRIRTSNLRFRRPELSSNALCLASTEVVVLKCFGVRQHSSQTRWNVQILHNSVSFATDSVSRSVSRRNHRFFRPTLYARTTGLIRNRQILAPLFAFRSNDSRHRATFHQAPPRRDRDGNSTPAPATSTSSRYLLALGEHGPSKTNSRFCTYAEGGKA